MKGILRIILLSFLVIAFLTGCTGGNSNQPAATPTPAPEASPGAGEEAAETEPVAEEPALRVIAGTVASAELLDLIEVEVVGVVTTEKNLPARYEGLPQIGLPMNPDLEKIVSLNPELYVTDASLKESIEALFSGQEIETLFITINSLQGVLDNIESLGQTFGKENIAQQVVADMKTREQAVLASVQGKEAPRVLVIFGTPESFMLATRHSYTGSLVELLGAENVADAASQGRPIPYLPFSNETVAEMNPDIILRLSHVSPEASKAAFDKEFENSFWANLDAVKNGQVYDLDTNYFGVTGNVRAIEALEKMAEILY